MKIFGFFISFLVLALSIMPCADVKAAGHESVKLTKAHEESPAQDDDCSPFCQCSCCSGFSINSQHAVASPLIIPIIIKNARLYSTAIIDISLPIWQPPRLV